MTHELGAHLGPGRGDAICVLKDAVFVWFDDGRRTQLSLIGDGGHLCPRWELQTKEFEESLRADCRGRPEGGTCESPAGMPTETPRAVRRAAFVAVDVVPDQA